MKILADAHISRPTVQYLESLGHNVIHAGTLAPRLSDSAIMQIAADADRIILTADKDYGELVFRRLIPSEGVVLLRLTAAHETERLALFRILWPRIEQTVRGHFVVVRDHLIRRTPLPDTR